MSSNAVAAEPIPFMIAKFRYNRITNAEYVASSFLIKQYKVYTIIDREDTVESDAID